MKTKINDTFIDTEQVAAIGALSNAPRFGGGESGKFMFPVYLKGKYEPLLLDPTGETFDPYNISSEANEGVKVRAKAAYNKFVSDWQA